MSVRYRALPRWTRRELRTNELCRPCWVQFIAISMPPTGLSEAATNVVGPPPSIAALPGWPNRSRLAGIGQTGAITDRMHREALRQRAAHPASVAQGVDDLALRV